MSTNLASQTDEERALFRIFFDSFPDFSGDVIAEWELSEQGFDPPDVICTTVNGKRVGVEICQWVHQEAMKAGRLADQLDKNVLLAIRPQPVSKSKHFFLVLFHTRTNSHLSAGDRAAFRKAFFDLIAYIDCEWPKLKHRGQPYPFRDLERFKPLNKHLEEVTFCPPNNTLHAAVEKALVTNASHLTLPQKDIEPSDWIVPAGRGQWVRTLYGENQWEPNDHGNITMEGCLLNLLKKKADQCRHSKLKTSCTEVDLLIAFHEAISYFPPIPNMQETAQEAAERARSAALWPFSRTYLLIGEEDTPTVYRLL